MTRLRSRYERRLKRKHYIRKRVLGSGERPRLAVFRSAKHIYVQAVDDLTGRTLASASTCDKEVREKLTAYRGNSPSATIVGQALAERLKQLGVIKAVFDRGGNRYHGRVKALAEGARESGLKF